MFQSGALFDSLTVGENVGFLLHEHTDLPKEKVDVRLGEGGTGGAGQHVCWKHSSCVAL